MPLALLLALALTTADAKPLPISAHNCYSGASDTRLKQALALGIDNIEIDLGWDESAHQLIVGHDEKPVRGSSYPKFESYIEPLLVAKTRPDGAPSVLTLDWKTNHPEAVKQIKAFLDAHADLFSSAPKSVESPLTTRRLTVCFTGSDSAKEKYDRMIPSGGTYRAFRDRVIGGSDYRDDPTTYSSQPASAYHRFLTLHWGVIERGGPPRAGTWTDAKAERVRKLVAAAHKQGYRLRFYCLNGGGSVLSLPYQFPDLGAAQTRWLAAADAGVDWVASDQYEEIVSLLAKKSVVK